MVFFWFRSCCSVKFRASDRRSGAKPWPAGGQDRKRLKSPSKKARADASGAGQRPAEPQAASRSRSGARAEADAEVGGRGLAGSTVTRTQPLHGRRPTIRRTPRTEGNSRARHRQPARAMLRQRRTSAPAVRLPATTGPRARPTRVVVPLRSRPVSNSDRGFQSPLERPHR